MTVIGYPPTNQEIQTLSDAEAEKAFAEHFAAPQPDYKAAIAAIKDAMLDLENARINVSCAAAQTVNTTTGNKLTVTAAEIKEARDYLKKLIEKIGKGET